MIHAVKTEPEYFSDVIEGWKTFEVRKNDRGYLAGDYLALNEYEPKAGVPDQNCYTGKSALFIIRYVLDDPAYCKKGYVVLGLEPCTKMEFEGLSGLPTVLVSDKRAEQWEQKRACTVAAVQTPLKKK